MDERNEGKGLKNSFLSAIRCSRLHRFRSYTLEPQKKTKTKTNLATSSQTKIQEQAKTKKLSPKATAQWVRQHPVLPFVLGFILLMGAYYAFTNLVPAYKNNFFPAYLNLNAQLSGLILMKREAARTKG